ALLGDYESPKTESQKNGERDMAGVKRIHEPVVTIAIYVPDRTCLDLLAKEMGPGTPVCDVFRKYCSKILATEAKRVIEQDREKIMGLIQGIEESDSPPSGKGKRK